MYSIKHSNFKLLWNIFIINITEKRESICATIKFSLFHSSLNISLYNLTKFESVSNVTQVVTDSKIAIAAYQRYMNLEP